MPQAQQGNPSLDIGDDIRDAVSEADRASALDFMRAQAPEKPKAAPSQAEPDTPGLSFGRDVSLGLLHSPRSAARGAIKGVNSMIDFVNSAVGYLPTVSSIDEQGNVTLTPRIITGAEERRRINTGRTARGAEPLPDSPALPNFDPPKTPTTTGNLIEGITQFAVGFKGIDKLGKLAGLGKAMESGGIAASIIKGAGADLLAFDEQDARLSNIIEQVPALRNPVTEYLKADPTDGFAEGKLKQSIEGVIAGAAGEALFRGVSLLKKGKAAAAEVKASGVDPADLLDLPPGERAGAQVAAKDFSILGEPENQSLFIANKIDRAAQETAGISHGDIGSGVDARTYKINFARINGPEDIKAVMDEMSNRPDLVPGIESARRGKRANATTLTAAQDIDGFDSLMTRRTGDAFNAEQIVAARQVYYDATERLMEAAQRAAGPQASEIDMFNFRKMVSIHAAVQKEFMGVRAEAGRALQAWSIPLSGTGTQDARAIENVLAEFGGADTSRYLAKKIADMKGNLNTAQINAITQKAAGARTADAMAEVWTLGLLTNPATHVKNLMSNIMTTGYLAGERFAMAAAKDSPVSLREGIEFSAALLDTQKLAIANAAKAFRSGQSGFALGKVDLPRIRATARDMLDPEGKAGVFSKAIDAWGAVLQKYAGNALAAGDEYSKTLLYQAQIRALATRQGVAKGLNGDALAKHIADVMADPPPLLTADAVQFAQYGTFTKSLGTTGRNVQALIAANPMARIVVPFVRTPMNIFKFTFERTPLALLSRAVREDISAGGLRRATAMTKISMGSTLMMIGADLASNGVISGAGPTDPKVRAALRRTGWQPYSVKIGDTWYSYGGLEPVATLLGMSADISEILGNYEAYDIDKQKDVDSLAVAAAIAVGNQLVGKTFMTGFSDLVEALSNPGMYGDGYVRRMAGSLVPSGVAAVERATDPTLSSVNGMIDAMKARIPGLSQSLPPRRNIWGEEIKAFYPVSENMAGQTAERVLGLFNPVYYSRDGKSPLDSWLLSNGFSIDMPDRIQDFGGVRIDLRDHPEIYDRMVVLRGNGAKLVQYGDKGMKDFLEDLATETDAYGRHQGFFMDVLGNDYDHQSAFISKVVRDYTAAAKDRVADEFPEISGLIAQGRRDAERLKAVRKPMQERTVQ